MYKTSKCFQPIQWFTSVLVFFSSGLMCQSKNFHIKLINLTWDKFEAVEINFYMTHDMAEFASLNIGLFVWYTISLLRLRCMVVVFFTITHTCIQTMLYSVLGCLHTVIELGGANASPVSHTLIWLVPNNMFSNGAAKSYVFFFFSVSFYCKEPRSSGWWMANTERKETWIMPIHWLDKSSFTGWLWICKVYHTKVREATKPLMVPI